MSKITKGCDAITPAWVNILGDHRSNMPVNSNSTPNHDAWVSPWGLSNADVVWSTAVGDGLHGQGFEHYENSGCCWQPGNVVLWLRWYMSTVWQAVSVALVNQSCGCWRLICRFWRGVVTLGRHLRRRFFSNVCYNGSLSQIVDHSYVDIEGVCALSFVDNRSMAVSRSDGWNLKYRAYLFIL